MSYQMQYRAVDCVLPRTNFGLAVHLAAAAYRSVLRQSAACAPANGYAALCRISLRKGLCDLGARPRPAIEGPLLARIGANAEIPALTCGAERITGVRHPAREVFTLY